MPDDIKINKIIVVPIDGSEYSKNSIKYLCEWYADNQDVKIILCYILPSLPPLFNDPKFRHKTSPQLKELEKKNLEMGERILRDGKKTFLEKGFADQQIQTVHRNKEVGIAKDICRFSENKQADAIALSTKGRSRLEAFFMGEISNNVLEYSKNIPVWLVNGNVFNKNVLIGIDSSENALRAVDHAGFILSGTNCCVTLFHTYRSLRRFLPREVLDAAPNSELETIWYQMAGQEVTPYMKKAKEMLISAGLDESKISTRLVEGSRSAADDILKEARKTGCGTIILGRRGLSGIKELIMGSVTRKTINDSRGMTIWIV
jgi:nucleotide-binding universal stress UspA family protein